MSYHDYVRGQQDNEFWNKFRNNRQNQNDINAWRDFAAEWERHALQLEARLAQAHAETLVARIQRNAYRNAAVKFSGMDEMSYRKKISNEVITPELAKNGLRVNANGNVQRIR